MSLPVVFEGHADPEFEEVKKLFLKQFQDGRNENAQV